MTSSWRDFVRARQAAVIAECEEKGAQAEAEEKAEATSGTVASGTDYRVV